MPRLIVQSVSFGYRRRTPVLRDVSFEVGVGEVVVLVGPNGAGKSTLLKGIAGLLRPMSGRIERTASLARLAYLPQHAEVDRSFPVRVADLVAMGLWAELGPWRRMQRVHHERVAQALEAVGLQGFERRTLDTLSGGLFRRVSIQRLQAVMSVFG